MSNSPLVIKLRNVSASYDKAQSFSVPEFTIKSGEQVALLGKSGSGKSTLLNIIAGFLPISQGEVEVCGEILSNKNESSRDLMRRAKVGMVFQTYQLLNTFSVLDNILLGIKFSDKSFSPDVIPRVHELIELLELPKKITTSLPSELSVGQRQRVSIARALIKEPDLILADEPTGALDDETGSAVCATLQTLAAQQNASILFVTHDNSLAAKFPKQVRIENILKWS